MHNLYGREFKLTVILHVIITVTGIIWSLFWRIKMDKNKEFFKFMDGLVDNLVLNEDGSFAKVDLQLKDVQVFGRTNAVQIFKKVFRSLYKGSPHWTPESTKEVPIKGYHISAWVVDEEALKIYQDYRKRPYRNMYTLNNEDLRDIKIKVYRRNPVAYFKAWFTEDELKSLKVLKNIQKV